MSPSRFSGHEAGLGYASQAVFLRIVFVAGERDFSEKVIKLRQILRDPNIDMKDINYIDLRFQDAVISPK